MTTLGPPSVVGHVADADLPWVDAGGGIGLKVLRVDVAAGVWVVQNRFAPGVRLPRHRHTGQVHGFTLSGRWHYLEYDWYATGGSLIHEPAGSVHTLDVPADNAGTTEVVFVIEGSNLDLDEAGAVTSVVDGPGTLAAYRALCAAQGLPEPAGVLV